MTSPLRAAVWSFAGTLGAALAFRWLLRDASFAGYRAASCLPLHCFCEADRIVGIRQPANTWSSFAFVCAGLFIAFSRQAGQSPITRRPVHTWLYAAVLCLIGMGSAFYHASLSFQGQFADVFSMYLLASFILVYAVARLRDLSPRTVLAGFIALNAGLALLLVMAPSARRYLFALLLLSGIVLEGRLHAAGLRAAERKRLLLAIGMLTLAFAIWVLDITRRACSPSSWLQGHAVWHVAGAISALLLYQYYRSEGLRPPAARSGAGA
jgi:hypothetical protein